MCLTYLRGRDIAFVSWPSHMSSLDFRSTGTSTFEPSFRLIRAFKATDSSKFVTSSTASWNVFKYDDMDSPSNCVMLSKWKFDFSAFWMLQSDQGICSLIGQKYGYFPLEAREVYHVKATPVRVVGKNLHHNAGLVVYSNIKFLYAIKCSSGQDVPLKAAIFRIFIFAGLGVFSTFGANRELIGMGSS